MPIKENRNRALRSLAALACTCLLAGLAFASYCFAQGAPSSPAPGLMAAGTVGGSLEGMLDPDLYILGPGDVLQIGFWGDVNRQEMVTVNPDGDILIPPVGPVRAAGKTLTEVRHLVKTVLSEYYRPNILSVSLISLRTFQVHVAGMVEKPGAVEVNGVTRVSQAIAAVEGILEGGSQRNIVLRRNGETLRVDLTRYLHLGDNSYNPFLNDGDAVYVPPPAGWVDVYGALGRPGRYEFVREESLSEILETAGGFRPWAYTEEIEIERFDAEDVDESRPIFVKGEPGLLEDLETKMGDRVFVRSIPDWHEDARVEITGEVKFPGTYVIQEGTETLSGLIAKAGGFTEEASLAEARLVRGAYAGKVYPIEREMSALGELQDSFDEEEKDLLKTMGRERKGRIAIGFEEIFLEHNPAKDPLLFDGDVVEVPRASNFVRVAGQIKNPGLLPIVDGHRYPDYIRAAGGFAPKADRRSAVLVRATSGVRVDPWDEDVSPGDIIWVPERPDRDWWQIAKDVLAIAAQLATIWLVVDSVRGS